MSVSDKPDYKFLIGIWILTGKINKHIFREITIFLLETYPDIASANQIILPELAKWMLNDVLSINNRSIYGISPTGRMMDFTDRVICLSAIFSMEEQIELLNRIKYPKEENTKKWG